jgi:hypothetical protein
MDAPLKQADENFCPEYGNPVKRNAAACVDWGVQSKPLITNINSKLA